VWQQQAGGIVAVQPGLEPAIAARRLALPWSGGPRVSSCENTPDAGRYETTNHLWLILEYCVGGDLMSLLRQDVRLPEASIHDFGRDMVIALQVCAEAWLVLSRAVVCCGVAGTGSSCSGRLLSARRPPTCTH
jgi:hypothetical protein